MSEPKAILGTNVVAYERDLSRHYNYTLGRLEEVQLPDYIYRSLALTLRDRLMENWRNTRQQESEQDSKRVFYLSLEFLLGRSLSNAIYNMNVGADIQKVLSQFGCTLENIQEEELDAGLGNGGLGRLAACFLDSCATLNLPVTGYGIRYEYGMFHQRMEQGYQIESPDHWLRDGNPWEIERADRTRLVHFYGESEYFVNDDGESRVRWSNTNDVLAVPYDVPIPGYRNGVVNTLRLWRAVATDEFNLSDFNAGDYTEAVAQKNKAEQITMVLYPNDASANGKELRLRQQYFLASASMQDVLSDWVNKYNEDFSIFSEKHCFQLNDTHPTLTVVELMRLLLDVYHLAWEDAWAITTKTMAYTNHTLLPEALEKWSVTMLSELLPRVLEIIYEINARFLAEVALHWPGDTERQRQLSLIEEGQDPHVRMAYLAIVGSHSVNGVAKLHSKLLQEGLFKNFYDLWPRKFNNKTNGVTPRRWLSFCNKPLSQHISNAIGDAWITDLNELEGLLDFTDDTEFTSQWYQIKKQNKTVLADLVKQHCSVDFDTEFMYDVQVKRIHEYKRQLLNALHVIYLYDRIKRGDLEHLKPRCVLIGGKAAPGYTQAKLIIKLINNIAAVVNSDPDVAQHLKLVFMPNYRVSAMEIICPATDLSEQISTAGKEASGTGNMKFMMNGALTIGTYDGANIEILDAVGSENFFLFGLKVENIASFREQYHPDQIIEQDEDFRRVMQLLECGHFNLFEPGLFEPIVNAIRNPSDPWMVAADFRSYLNTQEFAGRCYEDQQSWVKKSIVNVAKSGRFSSDRTISEYAREIWKL